MEKQFKVKAIYVGKAKAMQVNEKEIISGINKDKLEGPVYLSKLNINGDEQADLKNHGGKDKAVCVYPLEHYSFWNKKLGRPLPHSAFGENLAVSGTSESEFSIGDEFSLGKAILQVSQPRMPCFKVGGKLKEPKMSEFMIDSGYTGFYMRVLSEGEIKAGQSLKLIKKQHNSMTISAINLYYYHDRKNKEALTKVYEIENLAESWRRMVGKLLTEL